LTKALHRTEHGKIVASSLLLRLDRREESLSEFAEATFDPTEVPGFTFIEKAAVNALGRG